MKCLPFVLEAIASAVARPMAVLGEDEPLPLTIHDFGAAETGPPRESSTGCMVNDGSETNGEESPFDDWGQFVDEEEVDRSSGFMVEAAAAACAKVASRTLDGLGRGTGGCTIFRLVGG